VPRAFDGKVDEMTSSTGQCADWAGLTVQHRVSVMPIYGDKLAANDFYTVSQKGSHLMFDNNFGKCGPTFKILSPADS